MNRKEPAEMRDLIEKESPKNIVVSFLLAMLFGVAAGLAAIAYGEVLLSLCIKFIYTLDVPIPLSIPASGVSPRSLP